MQVVSEMEDPETVNPKEYIRQKDVYKTKRDEFMRKQLRRTWPIRIVRVLGIFQLLICLAILAVDLPIVLMYAPRWQVLAGCWTFVLGFIACVSTFHSSRKMTWRKVQWAAGLNILAGIAAAIMVAFDILYLVNPYICVVAGGCKYLSYTYSAVNSYYTGEVIVGIFFLITVFIFLIICVKYGIGGLSLYETIQKGSVPAAFKPIVPFHGNLPVGKTPATGRGVFMAQQQPPPPPPLSTMPRYHAPGPGVMMARPPGVMMMQRPHTPMMVPGPGSPMQAYYRQPGPYPPSAQRYQN